MVEVGAPIASPSVCTFFLIHKLEVILVSYSCCYFMMSSIILGSIWLFLHISLIIVARSCVGIFVYMLVMSNEASLRF